MAATVFLLESEGVEGWLANGLATRQLIDGDFDVALVLDQVDLALSY